jgi:hypothetical protein
LSQIENCGDIENLDCTDIVGGHLMYRDAMPRLMKEAGFLMVSEEFSEIEDPDPDKQRERQIQLYDEIEEAKKLVAQEEAEAIMAGKKLKKKTKKRGFMGLWGKEIEVKPADYTEGTKRDSMGNRSSNASHDYDPYEREKKGTEGTPSDNEKKSGQVNENVLFDVDKMRQELAANGITKTNLESTLPPSVVPTSSPDTQRQRSLLTATAPPLQRSSSTPGITPVPRAHSPSSLPLMSQSNASTGQVHRIEKTTASPEVSTRRPLQDFISQPMKAPAATLRLPKAENHWGNSSDTGITMSFDSESPLAERPSTLNVPYRRPSLSSSTHSLEKKLEVKPISLSTMPFEHNVWDDDEFGSGGNITMSFE